MFSPVHPPYLLKKLYRKCVWRMSPVEKPTVYLTFDDGPIPELTPWVLDELDKQGVKATFFCVGHNVQKHPHVFQRIIERDHAVGNHTFNHLKGFYNSSKSYYQNFLDCQEFTLTKIFRPPYGQLTFSQVNKISRTHKIIMWDVLSHDYSSAISPERCYKNSVEKVKNGSIIVFHDNVKAIKNLQYALPRCIETLKERGFAFGKIETE